MKTAPQKSEVVKPSFTVLDHADARSAHITTEILVGENSGSGKWWWKWQMVVALEAEAEGGEVGVVDTRTKHSIAEFNSWGKTIHKLRHSRVTGPGPLLTMMRR
jgi:hypothetical protein